MHKSASGLVSSLYGTSGGPAISRRESMTILVPSPRRDWATNRLAILIAVTLGTSPLFSQGTSYLTGYVQDSTGSAVPNANIVIKNENTGSNNVLKSTDTGVYRSPALDPGSYEIRVSAAGFQEAVTRNVELLVGQPRGLDISLQVGATSQSIEVNAAPQLLKTED